MGKKHIDKQEIRYGSLSEAYDIVCGLYAKAFAEKHGIEYNGVEWVRNEHGSILCLGDFFFDFQDIKYDIDHVIDKDEIFRYYDYCLRVDDLGLKVMNYENWCRGCPRISDLDLERIERLKSEIITITHI